MYLLALLTFPFLSPYLILGQRNLDWGPGSQTTTATIPSGIRQHHTPRSLIQA